MMTLADYAKCIPIGRDAAISRYALSEAWGCTDRVVRMIIHDIREAHNGDWNSTDPDIRDYAVLSSSTNGVGYWRSCDPEEIARYNREVESRSREVMRAWQKVPQEIAG